MKTIGSYIQKVGGRSPAEVGMIMSKKFMNRIRSKLEECKAVKTNTNSIFSSDSVIKIQS